jgi:hypothetical protein
VERQQTEGSILELEENTFHIHRERRNKTFPDEDLLYQSLVIEIIGN